jgi:hypothetical protein
MHKFKILFSFLIFAASIELAFATAKEAFEIFKHDHSKLKFKHIAHELIDGEFYFSAIPYINKYLDDNNDIDIELEKDIETLVVKTGTMAILNLDEKKLDKFNIPSVHLILGTRLFNLEQYQKSYEVLSKIPDTHQFSLEASLIKGTIKNLERKNIEAFNHYNACINKAKKVESEIKDNAKNEKLKRYYSFIKETCIIRTARLKIEEKKYSEGLEIYEQIDKRSYRWPYILMDKAWAHYYLKDFNRTLGLTITYKSPLLDTYFFPESEVLMALSYYNLCQWDDALKVVDHFYEKYKPEADGLKEIVGQNKLSDTYFLDLYYADIETRDTINPFIKNLIAQTKKQVKFNIDLYSLKSAKDELQLIKKLKNQILVDNLDNTISFISKKINNYIKKEIFTFINDIHKHSYSMFNLKLELLSKKREDIYRQAEMNELRERGSDKNVSRKLNQYFFDFNGSFWADELGDYSFGLPSRCISENANKVAEK